MADYRVESVNPQKYKILCFQYASTVSGETFPFGDSHWIYEECLPSEICVHMPVWDYPPGQLTPDGHGSIALASCVSTDNYRKIAAVLSGKEFGNIQVSTSAPGGNQKVLVDVLLTGPTINTTAVAQNMKLTALTQLSTTHHFPHYGSLPGGSWLCADCFNLGPYILPQATNLLSASVTLAGGAAAVLYVTTFMSA
ncbi:hypothetical protein MMC12_006861 [Toensbergia leucococca]|nr:hypothetical protein [Toensbergia leucococca]